jgi:hypothetical protein
MKEWKDKSMKKLTTLIILSKKPLKLSLLNKKRPQNTIQFKKLLNIKKFNISQLNTSQSNINQLSISR